MGIRRASKQMMGWTAGIWMLLASGVLAVQPAETLPATNAAKKKPQVVLPEEKPLGTVAVGIQPKSGKLPNNSADAWLAKSSQELPHHPGGEILYFWDAPDLCHRPLYYEQINAERHGYSRCPLLQPAIGGVHFFASTLALPYQMTVHPYRECIAPLGHYRAGSPVPYQRHLPEWNPKAAVVQTAVVGGLIFIVP